MVKYSIIVPVLNGYDFIVPFQTCLQYLPRDVEILIVDNGSDLNFINKLKSNFSDIENVKIYSYTNKKSSYAARNYGVTKARGKVINFVDFDCVITKEYFDNLPKNDVDGDNLVAGAVKLFHVSNNIYEQFDKYAYLKQEAYSEKNYAATANLSLTAKSFEKIGGFKEFTSGGDNEFCKRAIGKGFKIKYNENIIVKHPLRSSLQEHIKKAIRLGIGHGQLLNEKNKSRYLNFIKHIVLIFIPFHQIKLFFKVTTNERVDFLNLIKLLNLCFLVSFYQRLNIIRILSK